jgi:hypothetical protein
MSIVLSDQQISHILLACRPLRPEERTAFIAALFEELLMRRDDAARAVRQGPAKHPMASSVPDLAVEPTQMGIGLLLRGV